MAIPSDIAGLVAWYKADAITGKNDGDPITQWDDSSGNARHLANGGAPNYQTNEINGLPVVRFDGIDDSLWRDDASSYITGTTLTLLAVYRRQGTGAANDRSMCFLNTASGSDYNLASGFTVDEGPTNVHEASMRNSVYVGIQTPHPGNGVTLLTTLWWDGSTGNMRYRGQPASTPSTASVGSFNIDRVNLGAGFAGGVITSWGQYDFGEVCLYDNDIGGANRLAIEDYLTAKWIGLPPSLFVVRGPRRL